MRLVCTYKCEKLPISYHMMFVSLIKESIKKSNKAYYQELYEYENKKNKKSKNFCFSVYISDYEIVDDNFLVKGEVKLYISSPDEKFILYLYNGLLTNSKTFEYKHKYQLIRKTIKMIEDNEKFENEAVFKTLSPICIKDEKGNVLDISSQEYVEQLNYICNLTLCNYRGFGLKQNLKFTQVMMKKIVVKQQIDSFTQKTGKKYYFVNCYKGIFKLEGNAKDLQDIYKLGLGFKRNQGFGMLKLL